MRIWHTSQPWGQATTTVCSLLSPAATSTLLRANGIMTTATSGILTMVLATSTTAYATTTALNTATFNAGVTGAISFNATATPIMAPATYVNLEAKKATTGYDPVSQSGRCNASWQEL